MSARTICFTGMNREEEATLKALFAAANADVGEHFSLAMETEADVVVVDMDTIYGHMSWLRAHGRGQTVVALSTRNHDETDHSLLRPVDQVRLAELLRAFGDGTSEPEPSAPDETMPATGDSEPAAGPAIATDTANEPQPSEDTSFAMDAAVDEPAPVVEAASEGGDEAAAGPAAEARLIDFLFPGRLNQPARLNRPGHPTIAIDPASQRWYGPTALKPLIALAREPLVEGDWSPVSSADLSESGEAQPLARLAWLAALAAGEGTLLGHAADTRFKLGKWPQTEREFPRHFRIATAMMKGPASVAEIAQLSGAEAADVADFVNASLATGFAEPDPAPAGSGSGGRLGHLSPRERR